MQKEQKKHKYLLETIPVILRMKPELKKKWRKYCFNHNITYTQFIEEKLSTQ